MIILGIQEAHDASAALMINTGCADHQSSVSSAGVQKVEANVTVQANGLSVEQENIKRRIEMENTPGSI